MIFPIAEGMMQKRLGALWNIRRYNEKRPGQGFMSQDECNKEISSIEKELKLLRSISDPTP